jgi:hypothetical protein
VQLRSVAQTGVRSHLVPATERAFEGVLRYILKITKNTDGTYSGTIGAYGDMCKPSGLSLTGTSSANGQVVFHETNPTPVAYSSIVVSAGNGQLGFEAGFLGGGDESGTLSRTSCH